MIKHLIARVFSQAGRDFLAHLGRILGQLWHEVIGFTFLALAAMAIPAVYKTWQGDSRSRFAIACLFVLVMVYFGVTSFVKARKATHHDS